MEKLTGESLDLKKEYMNILRKNLPDIFVDNRIDFDKLRVILGEEIEENEKYGLSWNGKNEAIKTSQLPSYLTLRPSMDDSKYHDLTENLYIEGDNLEVLKLLQKGYFGKIKVIYIDPPYNTGKDFVYKDNFKNSIENYKELTNQSTKTNAETSGRYHTDWLNMMYPRLKLARNLLKEEGAIFISIDEHEYSNLNIICKEIFGEDNELGTIIWDKRNPKGDSKGVAYQHENILVYAKNKDLFTQTNEFQRPKKNALAMVNKAKDIFKKYNTSQLPQDLVAVSKKYKLDLDLSKYQETYTLEKINKEFQEWIKTQDLSGGERAYCNIDENGDVYRPVSMAWPNNKKAPDEYFIPLIHPVTRKECPVPAKGWRNPPQTMKRLLEENRILFGEDETTQPNRKYLLKENLYENVSSLIYYGGSDDNLFKSLGVTFDNPKPVDIIASLIKSCSNEDDIVLDFFSGSGTTAHAVMKLNAEDNMRRKFIMIQLPQIIEEKNEIYKLGYKTICDIGKDRIRKSGDKIVSETGKTDLDIGFKVFKLDDSNIKEWSPNYDELAMTLEDMTDNLKSGRTKEDLLFEILIKMGIELTAPIEEINVGDKKIFNIGMGSLVICLEDEISEDIIKEIPKYKSEFVEMKVVFKETGFKNDSQKMNAMQNLKQFGITDVRSV